MKKLETQHIDHINKIKIKHYRITYFGVLITIDSVLQKYFMDSTFVLENC